ncbi:hypothetical protein TVAG_258900 [Trichomonas vaginalis G3]|uniref:Uncharacterized protein n=1 Tax=Trichomonas vaginalis (strain ATCC PRA-98 / G3) TaxID=412133 RepID=A2FYD6_TRIV3|nr:hypothetical protein TVAGG3_0930770 [Trichomonas vaginalis G3]EAX90076.1 hypothetical protein TVAG_258900 [Trichomonas vaginalis G3]KAI5485818.1 hypothetical protein TVAGG3_0930770 [Trichomonas vaginalis G3]|eukprot:XP_001303006.1 hypothetical protein [Trichomonas vaginalis G3]
MNIAEQEAQAALDKQLYLSQQRIREDVSRRTDSFLHFAISTGTIGQSLQTQALSTAEMENTVQFVENSLMARIPPASGTRIRNQFEISAQFKNGYEAPEEDNTVPEEEFTQPIPCDYW